MTAPETSQDGFGRRLLDTLAGPEADAIRRLTTKLAEVAAERDRLRDDLQARIDDHAMTAKFVGERLGLTSPLPAVTSIGCARALADHLNDERDRLLVALRSVHCELYEGTRDRAFEVIDAALANQQDGEEVRGG